MGKPAAQPKSPAQHTADVAAKGPAGAGNVRAMAGKLAAAKGLARGGKPMPKPAPAQNPAGDQLAQMVDQAAQEAHGTPDPTLAQHLQAEPPQEGQPPSWAADPQKWTTAEAAVKPHWQNYPDPFLVVAHVYKSMGGTF